MSLRCSDGELELTEPLFQFFVCGWTETLSEAKRASVRVVAHGRTANAGLLEVAMSSGTYGSVCGMNAQAAEVAW